MSRDPRVDPRPGDVLLNRAGRLAVVRRTPNTVVVIYDDLPKIEQRYGVPNAWTTEMCVGAEVLHVAD